MSAARPRVRPLADLLRLFVPPGVWFAHFTIVYGAEALICTPPVARPGIMLWIGAFATGAALVALTACAVMLVCRMGRDDEQPDAAFLHGATLWLALLSGFGVIWTAFPLAVLPVCAQPAG